MHNPPDDATSIVETAKSPEEWSKTFAVRGIEISPRTLRAKARQFGQFVSFGRAMLLLPEHINQIFLEGTCHLNSTNAAKPTISKGASTNYQAVNTTDKALEKLRRQAL